jgi:hypothetical protein
LKSKETMTVILMLLQMRGGVVASVNAAEAVIRPRLEFHLGRNPGL